MKSKTDYCLECMHSELSANHPTGPKECWTYCKLNNPGYLMAPRQPFKGCTFPGDVPPTHFVHCLETRAAHPTVWGLVFGLNIGQLPEDIDMAVLYADTAISRMVEK